MRLVGNDDGLARYFISFHGSRWWLLSNLGLSVSYIQDGYSFADLFPFEGDTFGRLAISFL